MQILMPQLGETVTEGTITAWRRAEGESVAADEVLFELETDKVSTEVPAPSAGVLRRILVAAGNTVAVGTPLAEFDIPGEGTHDGSTGAGTSQGFATAAVQSAPEPSQGARKWDATPRKRDPRGRPLSPAVRRLVHQHNLDIDRLEGSGRGGRVRRRDVLALVQSRAATPVGAGKSSELVPFNRLRKRIAEHMVRSKATSPHVLQAVEVDFQAVVTARDHAQQGWRQRHGYALTFLPFIAYAVCRAIAEFPLVNASVEGEALRVHADVNLAIAVDLNFEGLVAPVMARAQELGLAGIAARMNQLALEARAGKLRPDDLQGGTYTISNSGTFGTLITAPIINQPQVAILSTDGIRKRPVVIESAAGDAIAIRPVGVLAQSFDHRAIDGAYSAAFLRSLKRTLESSDWIGLLGGPRQG